MANTRISPSRMALISFIAILVALEAAIRISGIVDFPIYQLDAEIGYIPQQSQSGTFLNKNEWDFNDKSMPVARKWNPNIRPNILLIGNSIVMGGYLYRQQDTLTSRLQQRIGPLPVIWPIAAGGWTQLNEMAYLEQHPEIVNNADYIAWEYMAGGLSHATPWPGEYTSPLRRPLYATWYVFRKYITPRLFPSLQGSVPPVAGPPDPQSLARFDRTVGALTQNIKQSRMGIIWLYPRQRELDAARQGQEWLPERQQIQQIADKYDLRIVDVAANPAWDRRFYLDDRNHLTVEGINALATILGDEMTKDHE